jgi:SAM-dependent methyltransferase
MLMDPLRGLPDAELFYDLYDGVFKPQLTRIAIILGLFAPLSREPLDATGLANATGLPVEGVRRLADYLVAAGLFSKSGPRYSLTPTAEMFLVPTGRAYAGDLILGFTGERFWVSVMTSLRSGEPAALLERFDQDAWVESYRVSRVATSLEMWKAAGIPAPGQPRVRILDLACGCGIKSFTLAQTQPNVRVTCVDQPEVLEVARDLADRMCLADRVALVSGDLLSIQLGEGVYEACLAGQITHYLTEAQNQDLFGRVNRALTSGGKFVIDVPMSGNQITEGAAFLSLVLWANSGGTAYAYETYDRLLHAGGFDRVARAGERWIVAEKR